MLLSTALLSPTIRKKSMVMLFFLIAILTAHAQNSTPALSIQPLPIDAEVIGDKLIGPSVMSDTARFVWGASVVKGKEGKYHMLYSTWECGDSLPPFGDSWLLYSKIAYATSDYPDRDFKFQQIVLQGRAADGDSTAWDAQMVHNPHLKMFNGKYYLYYIGAVDPGPQPKGSSGENLKKRNRVQQSQQIGVIVFDNFDDLMAGKYQRFDTPLLSPRTRVKPDNIIHPSPEGTVPKPDNIVVVNPTVVQRPSDGKYLLYFKGNIYEPHWKGVHGVAIADAPEGPFVPTDQFVFDIKMDDGKFASAEDPFVWYHPAHGKFYAVLKDFTGKLTGGEPGLALLESTDGLDWVRSAHPFFMKKEIELKNGEQVKVNRLERPFFLLDENGNPLVLFAACSIGDVNQKRDGSSVNEQIPVKVN